MVQVTYEELCMASLELVALYETSTGPPGCFGVLSGNDDDYGISWGAIQFTLVQAPAGGAVVEGSLPAILRGLIADHTDVVKTIFNYSSDPSYYNTLVTVLNTYTPLQMQSWATSISTTPGYHSLIEPWKTYFRNLGLSDEGQAAQLAGAQWYFDTALGIYNALKGYSPAPNMFSRRFFAQCFDIAVFTGGMSTATKSAIEAAFAAISTSGKTANQIEVEKMLIIAQKNADAESNPTLKQIKLDRSNAIANGTGYIYGGTLYMDTSAYGITMDYAFPPPIEMQQTEGYFQYYSDTGRPLKTNGIDISHNQTDNGANFQTAYDAGDRFAVFKAGGNTKSYFSARWIRCTVNGSYTNTSSIFNLIQVVNSSGVDVASAKSVTGSQGTPQYGSYGNFTDGSTSTIVIVGDNTQWVKVDLNSIQSIWYIKLWHYLDRIFKDVKIEYSTDNTNWTTLFDTSTAGEYLETADGLTVLKYNNVAIDAQFNSTFIASARAAGIKVGAYFFFCPNYYDTTEGRWRITTEDASSDASAFVGYLETAFDADDYGDCFTFLDWENPYGGIYPASDCSASYDYIKTFVQQVSALTNGRQCGVYTAYYTIDTMTADNELMLSKSTYERIGNVCPLWLAKSIDSEYGGDTYPYYGFEAWGVFPSNLWTIWQYSHTSNNSAAAHGFAAGDLCLDILQGDLVTIMPPSSIANFKATGGATTLHLTWTTGESDVRGYYYYADGITTATVNTGVGSATVVGLPSTTEYIIKIQSFDTWEVGTVVSVTESTTGATPPGIYGTLWATYLP